MNNWEASGGNTKINMKSNCVHTHTPIIAIIAYVMMMYDIAFLAILNITVMAPIKNNGAPTLYKAIATSLFVATLY